MITSNTIKMKTKRWSYLQSLLAVLVFATGQYRLLCVLLLVCINYLQRGRPQLAYINKEGHRMCAPINVYLLNVLFPEEEVMNVCI